MTGRALLPRVSLGLTESSRVVTDGVWEGCDKAYEHNACFVVFLGFSSLFFVTGSDPSCIITVSTPPNQEWGQGAHVWIYRIAWALWGGVGQDRLWEIEIYVMHFEIDKAGWPTGCEEHPGSVRVWIPPFQSNGITSGTSYII